MTWSVQPLVARLRARAGRLPPFEAVAVATEEWAPARTAEVPGVIRLPDEADRIVAFTPGMTAEEFAARTAAGVATHPPTLARRYRDATILAGSLYAGGGWSPVHPQGGRIGWRGAPAEFGERMFATNFVNEQYFGHWLLDGLSLELLAEERGLPALGLARAPWAQEPGYRALTGLALERTGFARVRDLWVVDDRAMNGARVARMRELRRRVRASASGAARGAPVFLRRVGGVRRVLLNQDALADALTRRGFTVLTPEDEPVATLRAALHDARLVVSVEGSALCHATAAMAAGGTLLAIQPPRRVDWIQKVWSDCAGLRLAMAVADDGGDEGFALGEDRLLRLLDLVARENPF